MPPMSISSLGGGTAGAQAQPLAALVAGARKADAVIRIDWDPQGYGDDPAAFGGRLANALLAGMYD